MRHGHQCVVFDQKASQVRELEAEGAVGGADLEDLVTRLAPPRAVWVMLPAGEVTDRTVMQHAEAMASGDIVIDGGNSFYKADIRRARSLNAKALRYVHGGPSNMTRPL